MVSLTEKQQVRRVPPVFSKEAEFNHYYLQGVNSLLSSREHAGKFLETLRGLKIKELPIPTEDEFNLLTKKDADILITSIWQRYFLMSASPLNTRPL